MAYSIRILAILFGVTGLVIHAPAIAQGMPHGLQQSNPNDPSIDRDRADRNAPLPSLGDNEEVEYPQGETRVASVSGQQDAAVSLASVRFAGSTLDASTLEAATREFIGQPLTPAVVSEIAAAVSAAYAESDIAYYAVVVPPQVPSGGGLLVEVTEGRLIEHRLVNPSPSTPERLIASYVENMKGGPLRKSTLDRYLSLIRGVPGQTVKARIVPVNSEGDLALELEVDRRQIEVEVRFDNSGVRNVLSSPQVQVGVAFNGVLREGDTTRISTYLPFRPDRYQFYSVSHETPIGANGFSVAVSAAHLRTRTLSDVEGRATLAGVTGRYRMIRSSTRNLTLSASFDGVRSSNYFLDTAFGDYQTRVLRAGAVYSDGNNDQAFALSGTVSQGLSVLGARPFQGYSEASFTKLNLTAAFASKVVDDLLLRVSTRGQYSADMLPTTERFSLGGRGLGLAFQSGSLTADRAIGGSVELSRPIRVDAGVLNDITVFAFADGSSGRSLERPVYNLAADDFSLASAGGGLRLLMANRFRATAEVAVPIEMPNSLTDGSPRFLFGFSASL